MEDWKTQISYNYDLVYSCDIYQPGPEDVQGNQTAGWETELLHLSNIPQTFGSTSNAQNESEQYAVPSYCHYQDPGPVYVADTQAGHLAEPTLAAYNAQITEAIQVGSERTGHQEAHIMPDSLTTGSIVEDTVPQVDPAVWVENALDVEASRTSTISAIVENLKSLAFPENNTSSVHVPSSPPQTPSTTAVNNPKVKARTTFSSRQLYALAQCFSGKPYLSTTEMRNLAAEIGLTYKQVKTWFQNRRMKLRRQEKDNTWLLEHYFLNKNRQFYGPIVNNFPSHVPHFLHMA